MASAPGPRTWSAATRSSTTRWKQELAAFTGRERALLFSSGYMANLGVIGALTDRHDAVLADRLNHASLLDAARLSGARLRRYAHGDMRTPRRCCRRRTRA